MTHLWVKKGFHKKTAHWLFLSLATVLSYLIWLRLETSEMLQ